MIYTESLSFLSVRDEAITLLSNKYVCSIEDRDDIHTLVVNLPNSSIRWTYNPNTYERFSLDCGTYPEPKNTPISAKGLINYLNELIPA